ncbi:hypothetical protein MSG28_013541 [Choristoneura fumiferana]|uniref:Uncharacterized protein n=1 Tax=Choristoneura fumiferana TaxID=7141 RepID=A0ACC0K7V4_CHOFU|nr:hypothetical protein MSG28_013541 [Choristoneura fumiferana]
MHYLLCRSTKVTHEAHVPHGAGNLMGNASKKLAAKCTLLTKEEQKYVAATFRSASKNSDKIREDDLIVSGKLDAVLLEMRFHTAVCVARAQRAQLVGQTAT